MSGSRATTYRAKRRLVAVGCFLVIALGVVASASASPASRAASAAAAAQWMADQQTASGAFFAEDLRVDLHAEALAAAVAGGIDESTLEAALEYIEENGEAGATEGARTGRLVAGIFAGGEDPTDFGDADYATILASQFDETTGSYEDGTGTPYGDNLFGNLIAANGQIAATGSLPDEAVDWIISQQCTIGADAGGFGFARCQFGSDVDTTALAINALANSGTSGAGVDNALTTARTYLLNAQNTDGGYTFCCAGTTSSDSTGLALTAVSALGEDAEATPWVDGEGDDPVEALENLQHADGYFRFTEADPGTINLSTVNALPGMAGESYPVQPAAVAPDPTPTPDDPPDDDDAEDDETTTLDSDSAEPRITLPDTGTDPSNGRPVWPVSLVAIVGVALMGLARNKRAR